MMIGGVILGLLGLTVIFNIYFLIRCVKVGKYRMGLLNKIYEVNTKEIEGGLGYNGGRYIELNRVSFNCMLYRFWIPVNKFYDEEKLLEYGRRGL